MSQIGWIIAFAASIAANVSSNLFPHFAWWAVMYELACIIGVVLVVAYDTIDHYRMAVLPYYVSTNDSWLAF
jgi:SHO1 osmosensor